ncbi:MAG: methyltransferase domain-containing protein [Candidatus Brocadiaceae bacterium]|nr:methyltransferase domain-containing protein [Candidatus Brocadiaceae bacterium]
MKTADFYDGYWRHRKAAGRTLDGRGGRLPERIALAAGFLEPVPGRPTRVVDLGCGDGGLGDLLARRGGAFEVYGADVSAEAPALADPNYARTVRCDLDEEPGELAALDLADADYVVALEVLEHLRYPQALLRRLADECGPATRFVFSFPNIVWYGHRARLLRGKAPRDWIYDVGEHLHWFTPDSFRELLASCGFRVETVAAKYRCPWILELLPGRLRAWLERRFVGLFGVQVVVSCVRAERPAAEPEGRRPEGGASEQGAGRVRATVTRARQLAAHLPVMARRAGTGYYFLPSQRRLLDSEWNVLIVLDACRAEAFRRVIDPRVRTVRSLAPCTRVWVHEFGRLTARRTDWPDILWVTANPVIDRDCAACGVRGVRLLSAWRTRWDRHGAAGIPTVHPDALGDELRAYLAAHGQPARMIVHYMQPHAPYIGSPELGAGRTGTARDPFLQALRRLPDPEEAVLRGELDWGEVRRAYDGNLRLVWESVRGLLPHLKGRAIVTADHGELLGEDGHFGHECRWSTELLRRVPWWEHDGGAFEPAPIRLETPQPADDLIRERLRALGYV